MPHDFALRSIQPFAIHVQSPAQGVGGVEKVDQTLASCTPSATSGTGPPDQPRDASHLRRPRSWHRVFARSDNNGQRHPRRLAATIRQAFIQADRKSRRHLTSSRRPALLPAGRSSARPITRRRRTCSPTRFGVRKGAGQELANLVARNARSERSLAWSASRAPGSSAGTRPALAHWSEAHRPEKGAAMHPKPICLLATGIALALTTAVAAQDSAAGSTTSPDGAIMARLVTADGTDAGKVTFQSMRAGVLVQVDLTGLPAGPHAIHIHEIGACEPDFSAAGEHLAPDGHEHGFAQTDAPHAGDLPNLIVAEDGTARAEFLNWRLTPRTCSIRMAPLSSFTSARTPIWTQQVRAIRSLAALSSR